MLLQRPEPEPERALDPVSNGDNLRPQLRPCAANGADVLGFSCGQPTFTAKQYLRCNHELEGVLDTYGSGGVGQAILSSDGLGT